ncbi:MAG: HD-GYP domain-containing protein [Desulfovibrionaceae bacterium]
MRYDEIKIPLDQLCTGLYVRLEGAWMTRLFAKREFLIKNQSDIDKIRKQSAENVTIVLSKCETLPPAMRARKKPAPKDAAKARPAAARSEAPANPLAAALKEVKHRQQKWHKERKRQYQQCQKRYEKTYANVATVMRRVSGYSADAAVEAQGLVDDMAKVFLASPDVVINLMNTRSADDSLKLHGLNVAVLSMLLGQKIGLSEENMSVLGMGALFHDIGKELLKKAALVNQQSKHNIYKQHPAIGEHLAAKIHTFGDSARSIILQHHEQEDAKGFPKGLPGEKINPLAKIVSIVDAYDNLCNDKDAAVRLTPHQSISKIYQMRSRFDPRLIKLFIRFMGVYPLGSIVQLSSDDVGMVVAVDSRRPLLPSVMLYSDSIPKDEAEVLDLGDEEGALKVVKSLKPDDLPRNIYVYLNPSGLLGYTAEAAG